MSREKAKKLKNRLSPSLKDSRKEEEAEEGDEVEDGKIEKDVTDLIKRETKEINVFKREVEEAITIISIDSVSNKTFSQTKNSRSFKTKS